MVAVESMIQSLTLAWLTRIFSINAGTWKTYLTHLFKAKIQEAFCSLAAIMILKILTLTLSSNFLKLLHWGSKVRDDFLKKIAKLLFGTIRKLE